MFSVNSLLKSNYKVTNCCCNLPTYLTLSSTLYICG